MYDHKKIEAKWQAHWEKFKTYKTTESHSKKFYVLDMFPYPSGSGLHVGHPKGYTATDIVARMKRLQSYDVLHPIGWDAFGLPAEQYAIQTGNPPAEFTQKNINHFRTQLKKLGFSFDYQKEVNTTDPHYYKWTQWIFLALYEKGLAEKKEVEVNWSEDLGTVLANEEVVADEHGNSVSERGGFPVVKRPLLQWVLKITKYADRLYDDLDGLDWPESLKNLQRNWIKNPDGTLHLRDWVFSRQRYWGEPIPIAYDSKNHPVEIKDLPLVLPEMKEIKPSGTGESPLANNKQWVTFTKNGKTYRRETNTMPQWAGSCWYYLAYIMKKDDVTYLPIDSPEAMTRFKKWLPVDLYIGGQEHAVLHLLYARFWHKVLFDLGIVPTKEPFFKIVNQGMILGPDNQKMSKSKGNVINPDQIIEEFGADTLRVYEMFMGPLEDAAAWSETAIHGIRKWLDRVYRLFDGKKADVKKVSLKHASHGPHDAFETVFNRFIMEVSSDIEQLKFNTAVSKMMIYINALYKEKSVSSIKYLRDFAIILSLFAPHISEELLHMIDEPEVKSQKWPSYDKSLTKSNEVAISVQINGKTRAILTLNGRESKEEVIKLASALPNVAKHLSNKAIDKTLYIPGKSVIFVLGD